MLTGGGVDEEYSQPPLLVCDVVQLQRRVKLMSVCHHVHNKHKELGGIFPSCSHPPIESPSRKTV